MEGIKTTVISDLYLIHLEPFVGSVSPTEDGSLQYRHPAGAFNTGIQQADPRAFVSISRLRVVLSSPGWPGRALSGKQGDLKASPSVSVPGFKSAAKCEVFDSSVPPLTVCVPPLRRWFTRLCVLDLRLLKLLP